MSHFSFRSCREVRCSMAHAPSAVTMTSTITAVECPRLVRFVADKRNNHAVEVEEEHEQVEAQLDERFLETVSWLHNLAVQVKRLCWPILNAADAYRGKARTFLCTLSFLKISVASRRCWFSKILSKSAHLYSDTYTHFNHVLLSVPCQ